MKNTAKISRQKIKSQNLHHSHKTQTNIINKLFSNNTHHFNINTSPILNSPSFNTHTKSTQQIPFLNDFIFNNALPYPTSTVEIAFKICKVNNIPLTELNSIKSHIDSEWCNEAHGENVWLGDKKNLSTYQICEIQGKPQTKPKTKRNPKPSASSFLDRQNNFLWNVKFKTDLLSKTLREKQLTRFNSALNIRGTSSTLTHTQLNENYQKRKDKRLHRNEIQNEKHSPASTPAALSKASGKIIDDMCRNIFIKIFRCLDRDDDNRISMISISKSIRSIPKEIRGLINPILEEMKAEGMTLDKDEFIGAMFYLYKDWDMSKRNSLMKYHNHHLNRSDNKNNERMFHPKINGKSRTLAGNYERKIKDEMKIKGVW